MPADFVPVPSAGAPASRPKRSRYDVVVVGAGALGLASAYHLIQDLPDLSVLVVDAQRGPGEGSTGASNAMVRDVFSSHDNQILAKNSILFYQQLKAEHEELRAPPPLVDLYGYLWLLPQRKLDEYSGLVHQSHGLLDATVVELDELRSCPGLQVAPTQWFEGDGAERPEPIAGGLFGRNCGAVAPERLVMFYYEEARRRGVEFLFNTPVRRLSFEGREEILLHEPSKMPFAFQRGMKGRLRISRVSLANGESVATDRVIVAAGAWADQLLHPMGIATACSPRPETLFSVSGPVVQELLGWSPPVHPIETESGRARIPFLILPTGALLKPIFGERRMWVGYEDTVAHPIGTRENPVAEGRLDFDPAKMGERDAFGTDVLPAITPYLPRFEPPGIRLENSWGGYYHFSPDGLPVVAEEEFGVIFVGGDSGSGIMKADSLGRLVAAKFEGKAEARLFAGESYPVDRLSLLHRTVEAERIIL